MGPTLVFNGGVADEVELGWSTAAVVPLTEEASWGVSATASGVGCLHESQCSEMEVCDSSLFCSFR